MTSSVRAERRMIEMSTILDGQIVRAIEGKVKGTAFAETLKHDKYILVYISGEEKPLALPQDRFHPPIYGNFISARDVTEGEVWFFIGHNSIVEIQKADREVWQTPEKYVDDEKAEEAAEQVIIEFLKTHNNKGGCSANDVRTAICDIFPNRDRHIVGYPFKRLKKKGIIHQFGNSISDDKRHHGSPVQAWHFTPKGREMYL